MAKEILRSSAGQRKVLLDPRTKLALQITICIIVLGGDNGGWMTVVRPALAVIPAILLLLSRHNRMALLYAFIYGISFAGELLLIPRTIGVTNFLILFFSAFIARILPGVIMGYFTVTTTTVSEFVAAMQRMHVTEKLVIPMSVMFRFFPTVAEEFDAIGDAMRMRGIRFGGRKTAKMLEYRLVPMMMCSVKIGEELSAAALTRGLGAPVRRTNICKIGFHTPDLIIMAFCILCYAVFILDYTGILQEVIG